MLVIGSSLAVAAGLGYTAAAALEKREAVLVSLDVPVARLLAVLARRRVWLAAIFVSLLAWVAEAVALATAPIATVIPLMSAGSAVLVAVGIRWLGERFEGRELVAVAMVTIGAAAAAVTGGQSEVSRTALAPLVQLGVGGLALFLGLVVGARRSGVGYGAAAGVLYAATAIYSKEIGDRFAVHGLSAIRVLATNPAPWALVALAVIAQAFTQAGFQRANAASVTTAMAATSTAGPIVAGFALYQESYPSGIGAVLLPLAIAAVVAGTTLLFVSARSSHPSLAV